MSHPSPAHATLEAWIAREALQFSVDSPETFHAAVDTLIAALGTSVALLGLGEALHGGEGILQLRNRMANGEKPKYPARPDFPPSGVAFLDSCLARDPMKRPTAAQLLQHSFMTDLASLQPSMQPSHSQANSLANTFSSGLQMSSAQQLQPAVIPSLPHQTLEDLVEPFEATGGGVPSSGVCDSTVRSTPNKVKGKGALAVFSKPKPTPS